MKFFAGSCLAASLMAATGVRANAPQIGSIFARPNTEFGLAAHSFFATYPGVDVASADVKMKVFSVNGNTETEVHSYTVPEGESTKPWGFRFYIEELEQNKKYGVKICQGTDCSPITKPQSWIDDGTQQLTCSDVPNPPQAAAIPEIKSIDASSLKVAKVTVGGKTKYYLKAKGTTNLAGLKSFFQHEANGTTLVPKEYCRKKYIASVVLQVVEKTTKRARSAFKFGLDAMTDPNQITTYITSTKPEDLPLNRLRFYLDEKDLASAQHYDSQKHDLVFSLCASNKDETGLNSVFCSRGKRISGAAITDDNSAH